MGKDKNKINPTPGVYYDNEEEARKVELARAQNSWTESGETAKGTEDPNEMYGGDIEPAVFVAETKKIEDVVPSSTIPQVATTSEKGEPEITFPEPTNEHSLTNVPEIQGKAVVKGPSDAEKALRKTYDDESKRLDLTIKDLEGRRANALAQDETAQRRGRSMKMIAGISDSLASLANLIGVGQGGSNIDTTKGALTPLEQKLEAARLERKADIKSIDDRLDQYRKQMNQVKMQKDAALAAYKQNKEKEAYQSAEAEKGRAFQSTEAEKGRQFQASEAEKTREHQTGLKQQEMAVTQAKIKSTAYENAMNRANKLEVARINAEAKKQNSSNKNTEQFIVKDADGKESIVSMPKETAKAVMNDFENIIEADLEDPNNAALAKAYAKYKGLVAQRGILGGDTEEILDARKALISLSPSMQERIRKYGEVVSEDPATPTAPKAVKDPNSVDFVIKAPNGEDVTYTLSKEDTANLNDEMYDILREEYDSGNSTPEIDKAYDEYTKRLAEWSKNDNEETTQRVYDAFKDIVAVSPALQKRLMEYVEEDEFAANRVN